MLDITYTNNPTSLEQEFEFISIYSNLVKQFGDEEAIFLAHCIIDAIYTGSSRLDCVSYKVARKNNEQEMQELDAWYEDCCCGKSMWGNYYKPTNTTFVIGYNYGH